MELPGKVLCKQQIVCAQSSDSFPPPGDLPNPGIKPISPASPALAGGFFTISAIWEAPKQQTGNYYCFR